MGNCLGRSTRVRRVLSRRRKVVAPSTGPTGQNGLGGGGNNGIPPLEEDVDIMSTSTASFRSRSDEGIDVHDTAGAQGGAPSSSAPVSHGPEITMPQPQCADKSGDKAPNETQGGGEGSREAPADAPDDPQPSPEGGDGPAPLPETVEPPPDTQPAPQPETAAPVDDHVSAASIASGPSMDMSNSGPSNSGNSGASASGYSD